MFTGLQEYKQSNSTEWLRMTKKPQGKEEAVRPPLRCHWKRIRLRLSTCHLRIQNSDVSNRTCIDSIVGLQLPIASHSILQSINVHCIFTHILLYYYIQIIQFIPYQPFHSFPHLAPSSYVVVEVEEASHRLHGSVWLYKWFKNSFPPRKCVYMIKLHISWLSFKHF